MICWLVTPHYMIKLKHPFLNDKSLQAKMHGKYALNFQVQISEYTATIPVEFWNSVNKRVTQCWQ